MNSDDLKAKFIEEIKKNNSNNLKKATEEIGKALGGKTAEVEAILNDSEKMKELTKNISASDLQKIGQLINSPELLKLVLSSEKGKQFIKEFFQK